jgi:hypothetical protein
VAMNEHVVAHKRKRAEWRKQWEIDNARNALIAAREYARIFGCKRVLDKLVAKPCYSRTIFLLQIT